MVFDSLHVLLRLVPVLAGYLCVGTCDYLQPTPAEAIPRPVYANPARWVLPDGAHNWRDIGGYKTADGRAVRWNTVYRSGELADLTPTECDLLYQTGIECVVDYRNRLLPSPLFGGDSECVFATAQMQLLPVRSSEDKSYTATVQDNAESFRRTFELLSDGRNLPLLYHCAAGKDRTGITTALLLTLLGVDRETIMADYRLSEQVVPPVNVEAMTALLGEVDRQGGIKAYLANIGVVVERQNAIRGLLLE